MIRDKASSLFRKAGVEARREGRDLRQRLQGAVHEARHAGEEVPDDVLVERVRAQLGRPVSHPRAIDVHAERGVVTLSGPILRGEVDDAIARVARIRGVRSVRNELQVQDASGSNPDLQ
jgi:osmotically-inducible protein OsmY